jgi:single-strand DNA-binding protein
MPEGGTERREETEFHKLVAWNKLAELCSQLITKGRKIYVEGRLQSRSWETPDGEKRSATEIVIEDMMLLDARPDGASSGTSRVQEPAPAHEEEPAVAEVSTPKDKDGSEEKSKKAKDKPEVDDIDLDDIPF